MIYNSFVFCSEQKFAESKLGGKFLGLLSTT
jgi:hypothetical protein